MPALILIIRKGGLVIPLPYFLLWVLLLPVLPLLVLMGVVGNVLSDRVEFRLMMRMDLLFRLLVCLHGLRIRVENGRTRMCLSFV
jgi:hypothetical protein